MHVQEISLIQLDFFKKFEPLPFVDHISLKPTLFCIIQKAPSVPKVKLQFVFVIHLQWMQDEEVVMH
jgi:hypothetical protein